MSSLVSFSPGGSKKLFRDLRNPELPRRQGGSAHQEHLYPIPERGAAAVWDGSQGCDIHRGVRVQVDRRAVDLEHLVHQVRRRARAEGIGIGGLCRDFLQEGFRCS